MEFAKGYENEYKDVLKQDNINKQKLEFLKNKLLYHNDKTKMHKLLKEKESKRFELAHNLTKETENKLKVCFTLFTNYIRILKRKLMFF